MHNLFVYGSLMFEPVWRHLLGKRHATERATLDGYRRQRIRDQTYPGIQPDAAARVDGVLVFDLTHDEMNRLDQFEGEEYQRQGVIVSRADGREQACQVYVIRPAYRSQLLNEDWDPQHFENNDMQRFLHEFRNW